MPAGVSLNTQSKAIISATAAPAAAVVAFVVPMVVLTTAQWFHSETFVFGASDDVAE